MLKKVHETLVRKRHDGTWGVTDTYEMRDKRQLRVSTFRNMRGIWTTQAMSHVLNGQFETYLLYMDFSETINRCTMRGTSSAVLAFHETAEIEPVWKRAMAHYMFDLEAVDGATPV